MKLWMALPADLERVSAHYMGRISWGALCPSLTREMAQDELAWYEIEVLRKMPQKVEPR